MLPDLHSSRLELTGVSDAHRESLIALNSHPEVMRHITGRPATVAEVEEEWRRRRGPRSDVGRGLGYWAGFIADAFVGWWGLGVTTSDVTTANLGYRLMPDFWHQGLATEGSRILLAHGFSTVGLDSVWASTSPGNAASMSVLERLGFHRVDSSVADQHKYELTREHWLAGSGLG